MRESLGFPLFFPFLNTPNDPNLYEFCRKFWGDVIV